MISPLFFPVIVANFNFVRLSLVILHARLSHFCQACVIFGAVTIFAILSWYFIPAEKWLHRGQGLQALQATDGPTSNHAQL